MKFYANVNLKSPDDEIVYDFRSLGEDVDLIQDNEQMYCMKQCTKMAYYISKLHNLEVIRMHCEFLKDENNSIWFTHASNIVYR